MFRRTTHLSEILEESEKSPVVVFKYSSECNSSERLKKEFEERRPKHPIYLITVQKERALSRKIADWFGIRHESPQVFLIDKGKVAYTAHHSAIDLKKLDGKSA
jgi:bacillithiol system protein YtxJ